MEIGLQVSSSKTIIVLFNSSIDQIPDPLEIPLSNGSKLILQFAKSARYLGLIYSNNLKWDIHAANLASSVSNTLRSLQSCLWHLTPLLCPRTVLLITEAFAWSRIMYGAPVMNLRTTCGKIMDKIESSIYHFIIALTGLPRQTSHRGLRVVLQARPYHIRLSRISDRFLTNARNFLEPQPSWLALANLDGGSFLERVQKQVQPIIFKLPLHASADAGALLLDIKRIHDLLPFTSRSVNQFFRLALQVDSISLLGQDHPAAMLFCSIKRVPALSACTLPFPRGAQLLLRFMLDWTGLCDPNSAFFSVAQGIDEQYVLHRKHCPFSSCCSAETREHVLLHCPLYHRARIFFHRSIRLDLDSFCTVNAPDFQGSASDYFFQLDPSLQMACLIFPWRLLSTFNFRKKSHSAMALRSICEAVCHFLQSVYYIRSSYVNSAFPDSPAHAKFLWPLRALDHLKGSNRWSASTGPPDGHMVVSQRHGPLFNNSSNRQPVSHGSTGSESLFSF